MSERNGRGGVQCRASGRARSTVVGGRPNPDDEERTRPADRPPVRRTRR